MIKKNFTFEKLQIFMLLYELQSFSLVALTLHISQSAVSRTIKEFERIVGRKLILNNQKPITLTEDGKKFYELAKQMQSELTNIEDHIMHYNAGFQNSKIVINIAISMAFSFVLAKKIKHLLNAFPEFFIDISFTKDISMDLLNKKDLVITKDTYSNSLVENNFICKYDMVFGASREYLHKRGYPRFVSSLQYHDFIFIEDYYYAEFAAPEIMAAIPKKYMTNNELTALKAIEYGNGIGIFPKFVPDYFDKIVTFDLDVPLKQLPINISTTKIKKTGYCEMIIDFFRRELLADGHAAN